MAVIRKLRGLRMKNEFDNSAAETPAGADTADGDEDRNLETIITIFSMIMHKAYNFEPDALAFKLVDDGAGYTISFRHNTALHIEDPVRAANFDAVFYRDMRAFLQKLDTLEPDLEISPDRLTIEAPDLLCLIDALDLYFKQDDCPLNNADNAKIAFEHIDLRKPKRVRTALRRLARDGHDLARNEREAYEYFLVSAPSSQPFVSLDHYFASIAARAKADIPVSLDLLRKDVLEQDLEAASITADEQRVTLEDSFMGCAGWYGKIPSPPQIEDAPLLLKREMHIQLATAIQCLLISNYALSEEIRGGIIATSIRPVTDDCCDMDFYCPEIPERKTLGHYFSMLHEFGENFKKAGEGCGGADLMPGRDNILLKIRYYPEALFEVVTDMAVQIHPENLIAQTHLRSIAHIKERLNHYAPANTLN